MRGAGYVVLYSNPRGSSGYSEEWGRAIRGPVDERAPAGARVDYEDVMAVVDTALEQFDFIDPDRLGVIGGSYGGYMTSWIVGHTNRFKAAISERAVNNLRLMFGSSDLFWVFERPVRRPVWDDVERVPREVAVDVREGHRDAAADPALGERPPLPHRAGRASVHDCCACWARTSRCVRFPAESHELTRSGSPLHRVHALRAGARVVRPLPQVVR